MSCFPSFTICFGAPPDSPKTFYSAGERSVAASSFGGASFVTAFESPASLPPARSPPKRGRSLAAALEQASCDAHVVVGRPFSAASSGRDATHAVDEPLTSHPLRSATPSPSKSVTREVESAAAFEDVDLASSPEPAAPAAPRSAFGDIGNAVRAVFGGGKQAARVAAGAPAAAVVGDARARAFTNPLYGDE